MFLVPAVAMRLWAEERRLGTIELLLTLPVTVTEVVLGKFLAAWCFIGLALALTFPLVLTTMYLGNPDLGVIFCAYLGSLLMAGTFLSVGSMTSALTRSQVVSFILAVVACLFLILAGFAPVTAVLSGWAPMWLVDLVSATSVLSHFASIARGVVDVRDLLYYLSVMTFMIVVNGVILQNRESA
jgi:ABC-2 type transport system permease protein